MEIEYNFWTGSINEVKVSLIRSIGQFTRHYRNVKIGITNDPKRRASEYKRDSRRWNKMIVKYKTSSTNFINQLEKILIEHHWDYIKNEVAGGGGPNGKPPYYLYILLK